MNAAQASQTVSPIRPHPLEPGSVLARALYEVWNGTAALVVDSPPGAGKTTLVCQLVHHLLAGGFDGRIGVATPTRRAASDIAGRIAEQLHSGKPESAGAVWLTLSKPTREEIRQGVTSRGSAGDTSSVIAVHTVASCTMKQPAYSLLIIDEAYQVTADQLVRAATNCDQLLLVGDPGQIGPVVTANTTPWEKLQVPPHARAPEVVATYPDSCRLNLDTTYRLGQASVDVLAPLYSFGFGTCRPARHITLADSTALPEISQLQIAAAPNTTDLGHMRTVAEVVSALVGSTVHEAVEEGVASRVLGEADVAVVVSHNSQSNGVSSLLDAAGLGGVNVGTADKLQGGQWAAVVALDPIVGHSRLSDHQLNLGRLCVMLSRHLAAMVWVHDGNADALLSRLAEDGDADAATGLQVRRRLVATPLLPVLFGPLDRTVAA